jgi:hypothetical protein
MCVVLALLFCTVVNAQNKGEVDDITGRYHFLGPDDTLAVLDEDGKLKGYIDVYPGEEESDVVLSYPITLGSRTGDRVELKTGKIHQKYYRFSGTAQHGSGRKQDDPDYLELLGDLEIVTVNGDTGQETVARRHMALKSLGKGEIEDPDSQ